MVEMIISNESTFDRKFPARVIGNNAIKNEDKRDHIAQLFNKSHSTGSLSTIIERFPASNSQFETRGYALKETCTLTSPANVSSVIFSQLHVTSADSRLKRGLTGVIHSHWVESFLTGNMFYESKKKLC